MSDRELRVLVPALLGIGSPRFEDEGTTIVSMPLYAAKTLSSDLPKTAWTTPAAERRVRRLIHLQAWQPAADAGERWYTEELTDGLATLYSLEPMFPDFVSEFERTNIAIAPSLAEQVDLPIGDRFAWKTTRTPPPMHGLISKIRQVKEKVCRRVCLG